MFFFLFLLFLSMNFRLAQHDGMTGTQMERIIDNENGEAHVGISPGEARRLNHGEI